MLVLNLESKNMMSDNEFIGNIYLQNCGDFLRVLEKSDQKKGKQNLFECEFINYPNRVLATKGHILRKEVLNSLIEQVEFQNKIWFQNCGDSLKILKKSEKRRGTNGDLTKGEFLWECEFIKYPYKILAKKSHIIRGNILNPKLPWLDKENLIKYIQNNYKEKPTLQELANSLNISRSYINDKINKFCLNNLINYNYFGEENQIRNFIESIYNGKVIKYSGKKEDKYKEIDIYFPELKKGIEYNGSTWHEEGNPKNSYSKPIGYHKEQQEIFAKKGINILFIWDYEWFEDFPKRQVINEQTKQKIREFLEI